MLRVLPNDIIRLIDLELHINRIEMMNKQYKSIIWCDNRYGHGELHMNTRIKYRTKKYNWRDIQYVERHRGLAYSYVYDKYGEKQCLLPPRYKYSIIGP